MKVGVENQFSVSMGKGGKFLKQLLDEGTYNGILATYAQADIKSNWRALFAMTDLFEKTAREVAAELHLQIDELEGSNALGYLNRLHASAGLQ